MIIGLSGYAKSGKDTVAEIIQQLQADSDWHVKKFSGKLKAIASLLTGIPAEKFEDQAFKESMLGPSWSQKVITSFLHVETKEMSVREFLQKLGTDAVRDGLHPNAWVNALMSDYTVRHGISKYNYKADRLLEEGKWIVDYHRKDLPKALLGTVHSKQDNYYYVNDGPLQYPNWIITDCRFPNEAQAIKDKGGIIIRIDRPGIKPVNAHPSETALDNWDFDHKIANVSDLVALRQSVEVLLNKL
jgi:hypothetical protein